MAFLEPKEAKGVMQGRLELAYRGPEVHMNAILEVLEMTRPEDHGELMELVVTRFGLFETAGVHNANLNSGVNWTRALETTESRFKELSEKVRKADYPLTAREVGDLVGEAVAKENTRLYKRALLFHVLHHDGEHGGFVPYVQPTIDATQVARLTEEELGELDEELKGAKEAIRAAKASPMLTKRMLIAQLNTIIKQAAENDRFKEALLWDWATGGLNEGKNEQVKIILDQILGAHAPNIMMMGGMPGSVDLWGEIRSRRSGTGPHGSDR